MHAHAPLARTTFLLLFAPCVALAQSAPAPAPAPTADEADQRPRPYSGALLGGYGYSEGPDSMGFGGGVRAGFTAPSGLYLGGTAIYHFGGRREVSRRDDGGNDVVDQNNIYAGFEGGTTLEVGPLVMRPYAGVGFHVLLEKRETYLQTGPDTVRSADFGLYVAPGITALYALRNRYFVGGDARYLFTPFELGARGVSLFGTLGRHFLPPVSSPARAPRN